MSNVNNLRKELERAQDFIVKLQETMGLMVPISADGKYVFIDGAGMVEIDHGETMRKYIKKLEYEVEKQKGVVALAYAAGYYQAECGLEAPDDIVEAVKYLNQQRSPKRKESDE